MKITPLFAALVLGVAALPGTALAHENDTPAIAPGNALLTVNAQGSSSRKPDLAVFTAGVATTGKTAGEALSANSVAMNRVIKALKNAGIADRDIQTSNLNLNPIHADQRRSPNNTIEQETPRIIGYRVNNTVTVKQRKLSEFGKVIDTLVSAGANQVNGPRFEMDDPKSAADQAKVEAIKKAREQANLYASAAGLKVVRVLSITDGGSSASRPPVMYARAAVDAVAPAPPIAEGEVELQANVTVTFELAP